MDIARWVFWIGVGIVAYVYVGYPLLLAAWARVGTRPTVKASASDPLPPISIVIAVRNEADRIVRRLENILAGDYPAPRQVIVVCDGSSDATARLAAEFSPPVELIVQPPLGKAAALNAGVARARHPVLVFADARQRFARDTLRQLAANFADPTVGAVSGELVLDAETVTPVGTGSSVAEGVGLYWRYEKWLRRRESRVASTLGATGAVYAMRRSCWRPLPSDTLLDDVLAPMRVVLAGRRVVFDDTALAFDRTATDAATESRRKVRTLAGNYQLVWLEPRLLLPLANPVWLQFVSHKMGRLAVPYALLGCLTSSALLVGVAPVYTAAFVAQIMVLLLAAYGAHLDAHRVVRPVPKALPASSMFGRDEPAPAKRVVNA